MRIILIFICMFPMMICAQNHLENDTTINSWAQSPVYFPNNDVVIKVGLYAGIDLPFAINDALLKRSDDSLLISIPQLFSNLDDNVNIVSNSIIELFYIGMKLGRKRKSYFSISSQLVTHLDLNFNQDFLSYLIQGNTNDLGVNVLQPGIGNGFMAYNSLILSYAQKVNSKLLFEIKAKRLTGLASVYFEEFDINLYSHLPINAEALYSEIDQNILIHTSSIDKNRAKDYLENKGYAFDFGLEYKLNNRLKLLASIQDVGSISWNKQNNLSIESDSLIRLESLIDLDQEELNINDDIQETLDSLTNLFSVDTLYTTYSTSLPKQYFVGAYYKIDFKQAFSLMLHSMHHEDVFYNSINLAYQRRFGTHFSTQVHYQVIDNSYNNFGLGLGLHFKRFEMQLSSYNLLAIDLLNYEKMAYKIALRFQFDRNERNPKIDRKFGNYKNRF